MTVIRWICGVKLIDKYTVLKEKLTVTRNKSIVPRRTMHTGRI